MKLIQLSTLIVFVAGPMLPVSGHSQEPFYKGKTITILQGRRAGGTGDVRVRALMPFLQKYIPGNPGIVTEFMAGAGGRKAANHLYRAARPDGLTIANIGAGFISNAILGETGVQYNPDRFTYLGSPNSKTSYLFFTRKEAGLDSLEKLRSASGVRVGAQSVGHDNYIVARIFAWILHLKDPKFVTGYSGPEVDIALLGGEIDSRANSSETVVMRNAEWFEKGTMHFHALIEIPLGFRYRHRVIQALPTLESFARSDRDRAVLAMFRNFRLVGSPYILPPETSMESAEIMKEAFRKALNDPQFVQSYKKLTKADPQPLMPEEQEQAVREISRDPEVIKIFRTIAGGEPLPRSR